MLDDDIILLSDEAVIEADPLASSTSTNPQVQAVKTPDPVKPIAVLSLRRLSQQRLYLPYPFSAVTVSAAGSKAAVAAVPGSAAPVFGCACC